MKRLLRRLLFWRKVGLAQGVTPVRSYGDKEEDWDYVHGFEKLELEDLHHFAEFDAWAHVQKQLGFNERGGWTRGFTDRPDPE